MAQLKSRSNGSWAVQTNRSNDLLVCSDRSSVGVRKHIKRNIELATASIPYLVNRMHAYWHAVATM
jgi:hypothetical protein